MIRVLRADRLSDGEASVPAVEMPAASSCGCGGRSSSKKRRFRYAVLTLSAAGKMPGVCCCGSRLQEPRRRRGEVTPVEPRLPAPGAPASPAASAPTAPRGAVGTAAAPRRLPGASVSSSPVRTNRRKPRSFEAPPTPKVANVRKPRSFGAEGWLKVDLPVEDSPEDMVWYRRLRNIVTTEHRNASAAPGELVPLHAGLYVGDRVDSQNTEQLRRLRITHVLNCATCAETGTGKCFYAERGSPAEQQLSYLELGAADSDIVNYIAPNLAVRPVLYSKLAHVALTRVFWSCSVVAARIRLHRLCITSEYSPSSSGWVAGVVQQAGGGSITLTVRAFVCVCACVSVCVGCPMRTVVSGGRGGPRTLRSRNQSVARNLRRLHDATVASSAVRSHPSSVACQARSTRAAKREVLPRVGNVGAGGGIARAPSDDKCPGTVYHTG